MPTETSPWQIDNRRARLQAELLQAEVDLRQPRAGIANVVYQNVSVPHLRLLQVTPEPRTEAEDILVESYVRGIDAVAAYAPSPPRTSGSAIYWRLVGDSSRAAGIELVISMQTGQLDSDARVSNRSDLRASEVWWLAGQDQPVFEQLQRSEANPWTTKGRSAAGAFLFRLTEQEISYVEIVAPADFCGAALYRHDQTPESVQLSYELFPEPIEKGVIRRVRVRGMLLPREHDLDLAQACYSQLLAAPLPLTT